jgi:hypothetical protein
LPKVTEVGETLATGAAAAVPVPVSETVWGLPAASLVIERDALRAAATGGVKVTLMVQLAPAATLLPQVLVCAKSPESAPVIVIPLMDSVEPPVFDRVTVWAVLVVFTV